MEAISMFIYIFAIYWICSCNWNKWHKTSGKLNISNCMLNRIIALWSEKTIVQSSSRTKIHNINFIMQTAGSSHTHGNEDALNTIGDWWNLKCEPLVLRNWIWMTHSELFQESWTNLNKLDILNKYDVL